MPIIANTTVISNFAAVHRMELLRLACGTVYLSDFVLEEIQTGFLQGYEFYADFEDHVVPLADEGWLHVTALHASQEFHLYGQLLRTLHSGEASCLAIAYHRQWTFLSDDKAARKSSHELGVATSGTLGVLLMLIRRRQLTLDEADTVLQCMARLGYYSPVSSLRELLHS